MLYKKKLLVLFSFFLAVISVNAQNISGRDFWFTFPANGGGVAAGSDYILTVVSDFCAEYTIEMPQLGYSVTDVITPGVPNDHLLGPVVGGQPIFHQVTGRTEGKGVHIFSDQTITVYAFLLQPNTSDAETVLPLQMLGTEYVVGFRGMFRDQDNDSPTHTTVLATEDNTTVIIDTWTNGSSETGDPGTPRQWNTTLDAGETFRFSQGRVNCGFDIGVTNHASASCTDQTGSVIKADKPIAIVSSYECADFSDCGPCDAMMNMPIPIKEWGKRYITAQAMPRLPRTMVNCSTIPNTMADYLFIIGEIGTVVNVNNLDGDTPITIDAPMWAQTNNYGYGFAIWENPRTPSTGPFDLRPEATTGEANTILTSDKPFQVVQVSKGGAADNPGGTLHPYDPESTIVYPEKDWESSYLFTNAAGGLAIRTQGSVTIIVDNSQMVGGVLPSDDILLDNNPVGGTWQPFGSTGSYVMQRVDFAPLESHRIESPAGYDFGIYCYAIATAESYIYMGGQSPLLNSPCPACPIAKFNAPSKICFGDTITFVDQSNDPDFNIVKWTYDFGDGNTETLNNSFNPVHTYDSVGNYNVILSVINDANPACTTQYNYGVDVKPLPKYNPGADTAKCNSDTLQLNFGDASPQGTSPYTYAWTPNIKISNTTIRDPFVYPNSETTYSVKVTDFHGCEYTEDIKISIGGGDSIFMSRDDTICFGENAELSFRVVTVTLGYAYDVKVYDGADTILIANLLDGYVHTLTGPISTTSYKIVAANPTNGDESCIVIQPEPVIITVRPTPDVTFAPDTSICFGDSVGLRFSFTGLGPWELGYSDESSPYVKTVTVSDTTIYHTPADTMDYTLDYVKYTDSPDCINNKTDKITVNVNTIPTVSWVVPTPICQEDTAIIQFTINGGVAPYYVLYSDSGIIDSVFFADAIGPNSLGVRPLYTHTYELLGISSANTPRCGSVNPEAETIVVEQVFKAGVDTTLAICTSEPQNLFVLLGSTADNVGVWTDVDGSGGALDPSGLFDPANVSTGTYRFRYDIDNNPPCVDQQATVTLNIYEDPTASFTKPAEICAGTDADLTFTLTGTGSFTLDMEKDNLPFTLSGYINGQVYLDNLTITAGYELIQVTDGSPAGCTALINQAEQVIVNNVPQLFLDSNECDATGENYVIYLDVVGGDPTSYFDNPITPATNGTFYESPVGSGNWRYKSASLPTQTFAQIYIDDIKGCGPALWDKGHACDCKSEAGDIDATPQTICGTNETSVTETTPVFLDANDIAEYYLYTSFLNNELLGLLDSNLTGAFTFDGTTMTYGTTYYVVRVVGNEDNPAGTVDRRDLCLSYSTAIPVNFYPTPAATWVANSPVCEGDVSTIDVELTVGTAPYSVTYNPGGVVENIPAAIGVVNLTPTQLPVGNNAFDLINITDANGCLLNGTPITTANVLVNPSPTYTVTTTPVNGAICVGDNVDLNFNFTGTPTYDISYKANTVAQPDIVGVNDPYSHTLSPNTTTNYEIVSVTDGNGCVGASSNVQVTVNTVPTYTITADKTDMCEGDLATITFNITGGTSTYEIDYTSDNSADANGTINNLSSGGTFTISPTDGNYTYTFGEIRDASATTCSNTQAVVYNLTVYPTAQVSMTLTSPATICDGDNIVLSFNTTDGTGPFDVAFSDDLGNNYSTGPFGAIGAAGATTTKTITGLATGFRTFNNVTVTDGSAICIGRTTDSVKVEILNIPTFTVSGGGEFCENYTEQIVISPIGDRDMIITYNNPEGSGNHTVDLNNNSTLAFNAAPPIGNSNYDFGGIQYVGVPSCVNSISDQVQYLIHETADASIGNNGVICIGENIDLTLSIAGGTAPFTVVYSDGGSPIIHPAAMQNGSTINVSPSDSTTYTLLGVADNTPANCPANLVDSVVTINVNPLPVATLTSVSETCDNDTVNVTVDVITGNGPFGVSLFNNSGDGGEIYPVDPSITMQYLPNDTGLVTYSITKIRDATVSSASNQPCVSTQLVISNTYVNPLPEGNVVLANLEICEYETTTFSVNVTSGAYGPFNVNYTINGIPHMETNYNNGADIAIQQMVNGTYLIVVNSIEDLGTGCLSPENFTTSSTLTVNPTPNTAFVATKFGACSPFETTFVNETDDSFEGKAQWSFDRGQTSIQWDSVDVTLISAGYYDISLTVTSNEGCVKKVNKPDYVQVYPDPVVDFIYQPNPATLSNSGLYFNNTTVGGSEYQWSIDTISGNEETNYTTWPRSTEDDHYYYFNDDKPGEYQVLLESWSKFDCYGNKTKIVIINGELLVNIPNSFTPNGDGTNDYFRPYIFGAGVAFTFQVFNRWGEEIFSVDDYPKKGQNLDNFGWDGTDLRTGEEAKIDTYIYRINVENKYTSKIEEFVGEINLLR
jgi:gliding motility-associated-like protein